MRKFIHFLKKLSNGIINLLWKTMFHSRDSPRLLVCDTGLYWDENGIGFITVAICGGCISKYPRLVHRAQYLQSILSNVLRTLNIDFRYAALLFATISSFFCNWRSHILPNAGSSSNMIMKLNLYAITTYIIVHPFFWLVRQAECFYLIQLTVKLIDCFYISLLSRWG